MVHLARKLASLLFLGVVGAAPGSGPGSGPGGGPSGLAGDEIQATVEAHLDELRWCYNLALREQPELRGRTLFRFRISDEGKASEFEVEQSELPARMNDCLARAMMRWDFPRPHLGPVWVRYPFVFETN